MSVDTANRYGNVLDAQGMTRLRADLKAPTPETAKAVARQFESLFVAQMLKSMRAASPGDSLFGSDSGEQYRDLMDRQLSMNVTQGKGLGLASIIERQLLANMGLQPSAPAPLDTSIENLRRRPSLPPAEPNRSAAEPVPATQATQAASGLTAATVAKSAAVGDKGAAFATPADFVRSVWQAAERAAEQLGVPVKALVAQAALETGWGQHVIRGGDGRSSHNLFGIKSHHNWQGESVKVPTLEYREGVAAKELASFRAYGSLEASFEDYARFLQNNPRYRQALEAGEDADRFLQGLQEAGYATDPRYADKIRRIMDSPVLSQVEGVLPEVST